MDKCYLVHITIGGKPSKSRIAEVASAIKKLLTKISPDHKLAYTSGDGSAFGFFMKSTLRSWQIAHRIRSPGEEYGPIIPCPLLNDDSFLVLEVAEDCSGEAPSSIASWLRFHRPSPNLASKAEVVASESKSQSQLSSQLSEIKERISKS